MTIKKSIAIGIIALFIGLSFTPVSSASMTELETTIPIEVGLVTDNGRFGTQTLSLTKEELTSLISIMDELKTLKNRDSLLERLLDLFDNKKGLERIFDTDFLDVLPGNPIFSIGQGRELLARYHGRVQIKKLVSMWNYPSGFGTTVIWGNGLASAPTQVLLQRQIGFMIGFVGLYIYIPPLLENMQSRTCFVGSSVFAWGISV